MCERSKQIINALLEVENSACNPVHDKSHPLHQECVKAEQLLRNELARLSELLPDKRPRGNVIV